MTGIRFAATAFIVATSLASGAFAQQPPKPATAPQPPKPPAAQQPVKPPATAAATAGATQPTLLDASGKCSRWPQAHLKSYSEASLPASCSL